MTLTRLVSVFMLVFFPTLGRWQTVSAQVIPTPEQVPQSSQGTAQDEAAIRKLIADHNAAFDRHDGTAITYFTDDADTRNIVGEFFIGKAEIEKLNVALNKSFANAKRTETIKRIRFLTPDIALVDSSGESTGYVLAPNGDKLQPGKGGMSFKVVVKKEGRWLITAMRNAMPAPPRAPLSPGSSPGTSDAPASTPPQDAPRLAPTTDDTNHAQDEAAIRKIVADNTDATNRRDAKGLVAHFSENIDHIGVQGLWRSNRAEIEKGLTAGLPTGRLDQSTSVERIRFLTPDVAVVVVRREYGHDKETRPAISTSVFHKMNGEWWIEAFQNTLVQSREEAIAQAARATSPMAQTEPEVITPANAKMDFSGDVAVIRKMIAEDVDGWNRRDPKFVTAHGSENHDHINVIGAWRQGKAETEKAMTAALATTRNNINMSIAKIRFITADVAIVIVRNEYTNDKETLKSISTSILHKVNGEWWNEAFQNTYVRPPAADTTRDQKLPENN